MKQKVVVIPSVAPLIITTLQTDWPSSNWLNKTLLSVNVLATILWVYKVIFLYIGDKTTPDSVIRWQQRLDYKPKRATNLICQL